MVVRYHIEKQTSAESIIIRSLIWHWHINTVRDFLKITPPIKLKVTPMEIFCYYILLNTLTYTYTNLIRIGYKHKYYFSITAVVNSNSIW